MARENVPKLVVGGNWGEQPVRERTRGMAGTKSIGSGGSLTESEQEVDPLGVSHSANKGEVLGESPARFIIHWNEGSRRTNK